MNQIQPYLLEISRIGVGSLFLAAACIDILTRQMIFTLMAQKKIPQPKLFFVGAVTWKALTSICLMLNLYTFFAAIFLAIYIFLASCVFKNFWSASKAELYDELIGFITNVAVSFGLIAIAAGYAS